MLLHAVVEITLDRATLGVAGQNEPRPGRAQLGGLRAKTLDLVAPWLSRSGLQGLDLRFVGSPRLSVAAPRLVK